MKILIIALSGIGDALMFTPALKLLKKEYPNSTIEALVMFKGVEQLYQRLPEINEVNYFNFLDATSFASLKFIRGFRKRFDISINVYPSNRKEYNLISFLIGAKKRAAIKYLRKSRRNLSILNNQTVLENDDIHNVEENVALVSKLTGNFYHEFPDLQFPLNDTDLESAKLTIEANQITEDDLIIGFHPGCATFKNHTKRRWEPEKFAQLASKLISTKNARILVFGGPEENVLKEEIVDKVKSDRIVNIKTNDLAHTAAIMKRCNLFISNDSSLMHIAAALKLKVIAIIGPTNTNYIAPWHTDHRIVTLNLECAPCFYYSPKPLTCSRKDVQFKCIKELSVEMVLESAISFL